MKGIIVTISLIILCAVVFAQDDTLVHMTTEVEIQADRRGTTSSLLLRELIPDSKTASIQLDLGAWLDRVNVAMVNRNGAPGTASTMRFRGLSSDHNQILWNGIPINSVALGTCDLSMIPAFLFDGLRFTENAGVNSALTPGIGATLNLYNHTPDSSVSCAAYGGYNSLLNLQYGADISLSGELCTSGIRMTSRTKFFDQIFENRFSYTDNFQIDKPRAEQIHNNGKNLGLTQDLIFQFQKNEIRTSFWHQQRTMELPVVMGFEQTSQVYQSDDFDRACVAWKHTGLHHQWHVGYGLNSERLFWTDRESPSIESRYSILTHTLNALFDLRFAKFYRLQFHTNLFRNSVNNSGYGVQNRLLNSLQSGVTLIRQRGIHLTELAGRIEHRNEFAGPAFSVQHIIRPGLKNDRHQLEFQLSAARKYRLPDFNELYWAPGGNPDLRPEQGYSGILSARYGYHFRSDWFQNLRLQGYYHDVSNWIQWQPATNLYWSPFNIKHVKSQGLEAEWTLQKATRWGNLKSTMMAEINQAMGKDDDQSKDWYSMIYTPRLRSGASFTLNYHNSVFTVNSQIVSKRYTDDANTEKRALPSYRLLHLFYSREIKWKNLCSTFSFGVDNVFDYRYESVRAYPLPGRVFTTQITFKFN